MATILVLTTLGSIATFMVVDAVDDYQKAVTAAQLHAELAVALDRAGREMRKIPLDVDQGGLIPYITFMVNTTQLLWADDNSSSWGLIKSGNTLSLRVTGTSYTLMDDVDSINIVCYDEDNTALAAFLIGSNTHPIRRIDLTVNVSRDGISQSLRTKVFLREFMEGGG